MACTLWPCAAVAVSTPVATMEPKSSESLTSHVTSTSSAGMPPPFTGSGASRVHSMTLVGSGSPEATPSVNGSDGSTTGGNVVVVVVASVVVAAAVVVGAVVVAAVVGAES